MKKESTDFSAEQLIADAFKFHSQGDISEELLYGFAEKINGGPFY